MNTPTQKQPNKKWITHILFGGALVVVAVIAVVLQSRKPEPIGTIAGANIGGQTPGQQLENQRTEDEAATAAAGDARAQDYHQSENTDAGIVNHVENPSQFIEDAGVFPSIPLDANPSVELIADGTHPERRHIAMQGEPFDADAWTNDPAYREAYLLEPVPSRCYECAQPGPEVTQLRVIGQRYVEVIQGEPYVVQISAEPGMPVSAHSFDGASFDNLLQSKTVMADPDTGIAEFEIVATTGVIEECRILFASPVHSGPAAELFLNVSLPDTE